MKRIGYPGVQDSIYSSFKVLWNRTISDVEMSDDSFKMTMKPAMAFFANYLAHMTESSFL